MDLRPLISPMLISIFFFHTDSLGRWRGHSIYVGWPNSALAAAGTHRIVGRVSRTSQPIIKN